MSTRSERVAEEVRSAIAQALLTEIHDPRLELVSVNAVKISRDLSFARVYWNRVATDRDELAIARAQRAFDKAKGFLRKHLGKTLHLRIVPELDFRYDEAIERGRRMDELLHDLAIPEAEEE